MLYQKYVINGKKLQYFGYMEQSVVLLLLLLLVFNRFFFDESFGNYYLFLWFFSRSFVVENLVLPPIELSVHIIYT